MAFKNISNLLISRDILEPHSAPLDNIPDVTILDINVLRPVMKNWILRKLDIALIITIYNG